MTTSSKAGRDRRLPVALTVAGLDPSGGAGVIADIRTFDALGVYGTAVISTLTYQSTIGMSGRRDIPADIVGLQLDTLLTDIKPNALKTGALGGADTIEEVARLVAEHALRPLVVDPVIASSGGGLLAGPGALEAIQEVLLPRATLVTPNIEEAVWLCGFDIFDVDDIKAAALRLVRMGARTALVTGGALEERGRKMAIDIFFDGSDYEVFTSPWVEDREVHGTGCVLSAAITAYLARGAEIGQAITDGRSVVASAMKKAVRPGEGAACAYPVEP